MGEVTVRRDAKNRVIGVAVCGMNPQTVGGSSAGHLLQAVTASLTDYLHVPVEAKAGADWVLAVDRSDSYLDRELDAVLETLVIGLKMLERDAAADWVIHEAQVGIEV